jgi:adenine deaminase
MEIKANFIDIERYKIYPVKVVIDNQKIMSITKMNEHCSTYSCTGASMPISTKKVRCFLQAEFARLAVRHGTVATVSDRHEIANVPGMEGVELKY